MPKEIYERLFPHQRIGIEWMYKLFRSKMGGVLGDDMGLGKTVQVAVYLRALFLAEQIDRVLIIVPATMKSFWEAELQRWINDRKDFRTDDPEQSEPGDDDVPVM